METAGVIVLVLFLVFLTLAVVATVRTVRAVKHGVRRSGAQARRVMEDGRLRARRYTVPGPARDVVRLRLELRTSIDSTYRALEASRGDDPSLTEAAALLDRLSEHAGALDAELKLLELEPDRGRLATRLPSLTDRAHRITHSADALRWAAQDRAHRFADDDLAALTRDIDLEAGALRHWAPVDPPADPPTPHKLGPAGL
ncbi:hypothetical protein OG552_11555 [Streptomyces sp. NBC_01476]|uniref:hypothetical protein n=1 Tax=Streptomyces sp. NBC_01476 TaxID=2903881 RepID=UPI002E2EB157|nr:hypothetical protein [Streptomyces sp. NBC_01476]